MVILNHMEFFTFINTHTHKYTVQHKHQKKNEKEFKESGQENRINSRRIEDEIIIKKNADHIYK